MKKAIIWIIIIVAIVLAAIWISGYREASNLVNNGGASLLSVSFMVSTMNGIKKSGFMFYMEHNTDYKSKLSSLTY